MVVPILRDHQFLSHTHTPSLTLSSILFYSILIDTVGLQLTSSLVPRLIIWLTQIYLYISISGHRTNWWCFQRATPSGSSRYLKKKRAQICEMLCQFFNMNLFCFVNIVLAFLQTIKETAHHDLTSEYVFVCRYVTHV